MKKILSRVIALALAIAMILPLGTTAFAAMTDQVTPETIEGKLTLDATDINAEVSSETQIETIYFYMDKNALISNTSIKYSISGTDSNVTLGECVADSNYSATTSSTAFTLGMSSSVYVSEYNSESDGYVLFTVPVTIAAGAKGTYTVTFDVMEAPYDADSDMEYTLAESLVMANITISEPTVEGYTATISAPEAVTVNNIVDVNIGVGHNEDSTFHAAEVVLKYDASALELVTTSLETDKLMYTNTNGTLTIENFDQEHNMGTGVYTIQFKALKTGETTVTLDSAKFLDKAAASSSDLLGATITTKTATVNVNEVTYKITIAEGSKTDGLTIPAEVTKGTDLVITADDTNLWDYTITAKIGETSVDVTSSEDGKFIIASTAINGDIVLTTSRSAKQFDVVWSGTGVDAVENKANKATYATDFVFAVPANKPATAIEAGVNYSATITIEGSDYSLSAAAGETVTIPGEKITGKVTINIDATEVPANGKSVTISGEDVKFEDGSTNFVGSPGEEATLVLTPEVGYEYTIKIGTEDVTDEFENNEYTFAITDDVTINVTKTLITENLVDVYDYVTLNSQSGNKLWLVVFDCTLAEGKIPTYNGANMFWSEKYGTDGAYCYLVEATSLDVATASAALKTTTATATPVTYDGNVNGTTLTDAADAQFVANMYNAMYVMSETDVTMAKFLAADMNVDHKLDIQDAQAIIKQILGITG